MKNNNISTIRYSITNVLNEVASKTAPVAATYTAMSISYENLISTHTNELKRISNSTRVEQVIRNHLSALRAFMESVHKQRTSTVGEEFSDEFEQYLVRHLNSTTLGPRSIADRRSLLRAWNDTYQSLKSGSPRKGRERKRAAELPEDMNPFESVLRKGLKNIGRPPKTIAKSVGVSASAICRWTRGAIPNTRSLETIGRLESALLLDSGELIEAYRSALGSRSNSDPYRVRHKERTEDSYTLKASEVTHRLALEWEAFLQYKSSRIETDIKRSGRGRWTLVEPHESTLLCTQFNSVNGQISPTAQMTWSNLCSFFGFLRIPTKKGGYGLSSDVVQTLAWMAVPKAVDAYLTFLKRRSGGLIHGGHEKFAALVASLTDARTGYLTQQQSFGDRLPEGQLGDMSWTKACEKARQVSMVWKSDSVHTSRNPSEPIQFLLDQKEPLKPIFAAMKRLREIGDRAGSGTVQQAIARRDELLLGWLVANPLRRTNVVTLTYNSKNTGKVLETASGQWRIKLHGSTFKNRKRVGSEVYDVPVASWLVPMLKEYVQSFRPILCKSHDSGHLFVTQGGKRYSSLSQHVAELTRRHIPGCSGFAMHAFRHLVATDWLTKHHNDFLTVAELLNDTIQVVMKDYAHLKKDVAFARFDTYISSIM